MTFDAIDMTRATPLNQISRGQIEQFLSSLDPSTRQVAEIGLPQALSGSGESERLLGKARDTYQQGGKTAKTLDAQGNYTLGSQPSTAGPRDNYSQQAEKTAGTYFVPMESVGRIKGKGEKPFSGEHLTKCLNKASPERRAAFMKKHGIVKSPEGGYLLPVQSTSAALTSGNNPIGNTAQDVVARNGFDPALMDMVGGGMGGLAGGTALAPALGGNYMGNIVGAGGYGGMAATAQVIGLDGMAFTMRKQMRSYAEDFKDASLISMINNPGIPIEDLIFMFMAHMADKYEYKLRQKMEETAMAEKRERQREREMDKSRMLGGIASLVPGVGPLIGGAIQMGTMEKLRVKDALNGHTKSSTMLMQEVQMLMQKWKQLNEMLSNLSKSLHDMAMTPIRNLR